MKIVKGLLSALLFLTLGLFAGNALSEPLAELRTSDGYRVVLTTEAVPEACPVGSYAVIAVVPSGGYHYGCWISRDGKVLVYWIDLDEVSEFPIEQFVPFKDPPVKKSALDLRT